jgi:hypothetical protein
MSQPPLLDRILHTVPRRYRLADLNAPPAGADADDPAVLLAIAIEQARIAVHGGHEPDPAHRRQFLDALARMIAEGMRADGGDPAFQAMVLRHRTPHVREYASLAAHAEQDRRVVLATVNAIAHPAKLARVEPGLQRDALMQLQTHAAAAAWTALADCARHLVRDAAQQHDAGRTRSLLRLADGPELARLQRMSMLASDALVQQYRILWDRHGPRSGTSAATARGNAAQQRGAAVEALASRAIHALARRLNEADAGHARHCVVTSMRVPASIPGSPDRAKSEWDVVLLRQAQADDGAPAWDVCLLVEVKASPDAATTDFPRLLRGLSLLASAETDAIYTFATRQGEVRLTGASLAALPADQRDPCRQVLYCSDAPADAPRLLSAASRMQLLSAEASLAYAGRLAGRQPVAASDLAPVWQSLLTSPRWTPVLNQYPTLRNVRELMVHIDDLAAANP